MAEILVVGLSARALAQSARSAGFRPLAADLFGDLDLQDAAERSVRIEGDLESGLEWEPLAEALEALAASSQPIGIVCGAGFEERPQLIGRLAGRWALFGNSAAAVPRVKNPDSLAAACKRLAIPHPKWSEEPRSGPAWMRKRRGGSGGAHVAAALDLREAHPVASRHPASLVPGEESHRRGMCENSSKGGEAHLYWQERVGGEPVSALVLGAGEAAIVLGFSVQWADPAPHAPFRYGGAARPAELPQVVESALGEAARRIVEEFGLIGLNSVDFLLGPEAWHLIEVNPRPGATLDIFHPQRGSLFLLHVEACRGRLPEEMPGFAGAEAAQIVYAARTLARIPDFDWPDWTADRQPPGTRVEAGAPLCTVLANAHSCEQARRLVQERAGLIRAALGPE